jgi:hypothetical protein
MTDQTISPEALAWQAIERCRRDIEAAWSQIETARLLLRRSRWMLERWIAQMEAQSAARLSQPDSADTAADVRELVHRRTRRRRRQRKRGAASQRRRIIRGGSAQERRSRGLP